MRLMGLDYGTKRVGIALSDEAGALAFPETTLLNAGKLLERLSSLAKEKGVERIILGQSLDFKNKPNKLMKGIADLKMALESAGFTIVYEPEHMTSAAAARIQGKGDNIDASAAALILQSYLDKMKHSGSGNERVA
ncbi:MAG TPA: RuvX/YqgF family protein [Candidatus Paceibacterota bacterium]